MTNDWKPDESDKINEPEPVEEPIERAPTRNVPKFYSESADPPPAKISAIKGRRIQGKPGRFVFADMSGVVLLVWLPVVIAFFFPFEKLFGKVIVTGDMDLSHILVALVISIGPWAVLFNHLRKGRLMDGVTDMFLWSIWECMAVITLSFFYQEQAREVLWNSTAYWNEMREWLVTGEGAEGDPSLWTITHAKHLVIIFFAAVPFGLPALMMGVLQLNYMNYYVAKCMLESDNPLLTGIVAWHFWSILRVAGYIIISSTIFHAILGLVARVHWRAGQFWGGISYGLLFVILDGFCKWQFAENLRQVIIELTSF